jgi:hypothetical protein
MKKLLLSLAAASVMLVSCSKEEPIAPTKTSEASKAVIKGVAMAQLAIKSDANGDDFYENAPEGTVIVAVVTHTLANGSQSQAFRYETKVTAGNYKFEIPSVNAGTTIQIVPSQFFADQSQPEGVSPSTYKKNFEAEVEEFEVIGGVNVEHDIYYEETSTVGLGG